MRNWAGSKGILGLCRDCWRETECEKEFPVNLLIFLRQTPRECQVVSLEVNLCLQISKQTGTCGGQIFGTESNLLSPSHPRVNFRDAGNWNLNRPGKARYLASHIGKRRRRRRVNNAPSDVVEETFDCSPLPIFAAVYCSWRVPSSAPVEVHQMAVIIIIYNQSTAIE